MGLSTIERKYAIVYTGVSDVLMTLEMAKKSSEVYNPELDGDNSTTEYEVFDTFKEAKKYTIDYIKSLIADRKRDLAQIRTLTDSLSCPNKR